MFHDYLASSWFIIRYSKIVIRVSFYKLQKSALNTRHDASLVMMLFSGVTDGRAPCFCDLICGGNRSSRLRENAEGARNAPTGKSLKTQAREARNERKGIMTQKRHHDPARMSGSLSSY
jgi:hypothetical protein